jgi:hypothetical protein
LIFSSCDHVHLQVTNRLPLPNISVFFRSISSQTLWEHWYKLQQLLLNASELTENDYSSLSLTKINGVVIIEASYNSSYFVHLVGQWVVKLPVTSISLQIQKETLRDMVEMITWTRKRGRVTVVTVIILIVQLTLLLQCFCLESNLTK